MTTQPTQTQKLDPHPGIALYTQRYLNFYDFLVLGVFNNHVWRCPSSTLLSWYDRHITGNHLDVGVGTGYFLDRCRFPTESPTVALLDLNEAALRHTERRLQRYRPILYRSDVLEPFELDHAPFQSIGLNYLLHCLPGNMEYKSRALGHLRGVLADDGVLFGSTLMVEHASERVVSRVLHKAGNRRGIFSSLEDTVPSLEAALGSHFGSFELEIHGCVALFAARK